MAERTFSRTAVDVCDDDAATHDWAAPVRRALLSLPDDAPGEPRYLEKYASDNAPVLHGTTAYIPHGLRRSMEVEFRENDREEGAAAGRWWANYHYVVYEKAAEEAVRVYELAPIHTRDKVRLVQRPSLP